MEPCETINYRGYEIEISTEFELDHVIDMIQENDYCFIVYDHRDFTVEKNGFNPDDIFEHLQDGYKTYKNYWVFPLFAYIHSGVALSMGKTSYPFTDSWDTSFKGFVLVNRKEIYNKQKAIKAAENVVQIWNDCLSGNVWWFQTQFNSCGGFIGNEGYNEMIEEAKAGINYAIQENVKKRINQVKGYIISRVPLIYRKSSIL